MMKKKVGLGSVSVSVQVCHQQGQQSVKGFVCFLLLIFLVLLRLFLLVVDGFGLDLVCWYDQVAIAPPDCDCRGNDKNRLISHYSRQKMNVQSSDD